MLAAIIGSGVVWADPPIEIAYTDAGYDAVVRRTDADGLGTYDPLQHKPVELLEIRLGRWAPTNPQSDLFAGGYVQGGGYLRLQLVLDGLHNPPGGSDTPDFDPFAYGPHPVYGFVEIDIDEDSDTGGELDAPQYRYLANIARFGGLPEGEAFEHRAAVNADDVDGDFTTMPHVERHGEEFHLALLGEQFEPADVVVTAGDGDLIFEQGETWTIPGAWFHRAHGYERYSLAVGGAVAGEYSPECVLRFAHDLITDRTSVVLVFPLTNASAAAMHGESPQPNNHDPSDQASINEALHDLIESAGLVTMFPTGEPEEQLIVGWDGRGQGGFLQPGAWRITAILGASYSVPGFGFVWTDAWPNVLRGNVNGENGVNCDDVDAIEDFIEYHDLDDGWMDEQVTMVDFAHYFTVFDVNHNGVVDALDIQLASAPGDMDGDADVDLADLARFQRCHGWVGGSGDLGCGVSDLDGDGVVGRNDLKWFGNVMGGPGQP